ncbi:MAG TPA: 16S rRNA (uracil(1498)-N(3))-methyltransferase [Azospira sp.]|nr:16S rRNA (uracil(1498)-N(3))-methyltransferase [Azospira sp.]
MTDPRFFCPPAALTLSSGIRVDLPEGPARHAARVLRLEADDGLVLFDGEGGEYPAIIETVVKDRVGVLVGEHCPVERESPLALTLIQALQGGDKMDFTLQKAVELGVSRFQPVSSRRSIVRLEGERAAKRLEHWRGVAVAACEQCGRNRVPEVASLLPLERALGQADGGSLRLVLLPGAAQSLASLPPPQGPVVLLVGAEGGLAPEEAEAALAAGFTAVSLGPRVLRTETAGLAALAAIQALWGDFRGG